jgi:hypothetical protein
MEYGKQRNKGRRRRKAEETGNNNFNFSGNNLFCVITLSTFHLFLLKLKVKYILVLN